MKLPFLDYSYSIDTSSLIHLKHYPSDVFQSLWENLENLIQNGRLISPREVLKELEKRDDEILKWARIHKKMFRDLDPEQTKIVTDVLSNFLTLIDPNKETPDADPFVIALAKSEGCSVITQEKKTTDPNSKPRIPNVCEKYNIKAISLFDFFRELKWKF